MKIFSLHCFVGIVLPFHNYLYVMFGDLAIGRNPRITVLAPRQIEVNIDPSRRSAKSRVFLCTHQR